MAKGKRIEIQTLERGSHADLTRGDAFTMAATLEIMRGLYDDQRWPMTYPGFARRFSGTDTPLRAHVLSGLLVRPDAGSYLAVDAGALLAVVPAADADDSALELVNDPGVNDAGALVFVTNAAGSVRLDIVEVSIADTTLESATVGIFNTGTRSFDPVAHPKVKAPRLSYRIRQGVAGSGLPAMASGWLPLAVICHQPSTTSFGDCDMWDVRPLVADMMQFGTPALDPLGDPSKFEQSAKGRWKQSVADKLQGYAVSQFNGYIAGGQLLASAAFPIAGHGVATDSFDVSYAPNQTAGFSLDANTIAHVAALFPGGLPRWVKYTDSGSPGIGGARVPAGPRGILTVTSAQPLTNGSYESVTPPAVSGFTAGAPGVALVSLAVNSIASFLMGACVDDHVTFGSSLMALPGIAGVGTPTVTWAFSPRSGVVVPAHAKAIDLTFLITTATDGQFSISVKRDAADADLIFLHYAAYFATAGSHNVTVRGIPLATALPWLADAGGLAAQTHISLVGPANITACEARIAGYSL